VPSESALPSAAKLADFLAKKSGYPGRGDDVLTKVSQFLEEDAGDRGVLLDAVSGIFDQGVPEDYQSALMGFLAKLQPQLLPPLIVTTNYDVLVERTLQKAKIPFLTLCQIVKGPKTGRFIFYETLDGLLSSSSILTFDQTNDLLQDLEEKRNLPVVLYKMHGTARMQGHFGGRNDAEIVDSIVLTENDYIDFLAQDRIRKIPTKILQVLRVARLLFLGYSLEDWNFRVLLRRINLLQQQRNDEKLRHWACLLNADTVEKGFWNKRGVNVYECGLDIFLEALQKELADERESLSRPAAV
jgi:hypothetical protein